MSSGGFSIAHVTNKGDCTALCCCVRLWFVSFSGVTSDFCCHHVPSGQHSATGHMMFCHKGSLCSVPKELQVTPVSGSKQPAAKLCCN